MMSSLSERTRGAFCAYELKKKMSRSSDFNPGEGKVDREKNLSQKKDGSLRALQTLFHHDRFCGAGAYSDGKLSLSPDVGGNLPSILGYDETLKLIHESDEIYLDFGADQNVYGIDRQNEIREIRKAAINANLKLVECPIRHLGTEEGYRIYGRLQRHLEDCGVDLLFERWWRIS